MTKKHSEQSRESVCERAKSKLHHSVRQSDNNFVGFLFRTKMLNHDKQF